MTTPFPTSVTAAALEREATAAASGDVKAWSALMSMLEPLVRCLTVRRAGRRLSEAGHNDLFVRVVDSLRDNNRQRLVAYVNARTRYPSLDFATYLAALVSSALADYIRRRPGKERPRHSVARELERAVPAGIQLDLSPLGDPSFPARERRALLLWLHGNDAIDIAAELELVSADDARRLLEAARARLRQSGAPP